MAKITIKILWDITCEMRDDIEKLEEQLGIATETIQELTDRVEKLEAIVDEAGLEY